MSLIKSNSIQIGQSTTATQNFTLSVPSSPDGTIKLARGNSGATTNDVFSVNATGSLIVSKQPAFSAYSSSNQTLTSATYTKLQINTELFDTDSCYDNSTNYRFTPNVAGYYQVNLCARMYGQTSPATYVWSIYKNGSNYVYLNVNTNLSTYDARSISSLIYMNGSTDYIEFYGYIQASGTIFVEGGSGNTSANAVLIKAV